MVVIMPGMTDVRIESDGADSLVWIKAAPGARRDEVAGVIGERLKIRVGAPPEGGKANKAICSLLARVLNLRRSQVTIETGLTSAEKIVRICNIAPTDVLQRLTADGALLTRHPGHDGSGTPD